MKIRTLRAKLTIANILPILVLTPLLSLYLLYSLENWFTQKLLQRLTQQAHALLSQVQEQPHLLTDPQAAQRFLTNAAPITDAHVLLLTATGEILASTRVEYAARIGKPYTGTPCAGLARRTGARDGARVDHGGGLCHVACRWR